MTLNSKNTINNCIQSVKRQTYPLIEHIIQDGGSIDETLEFAKRHESGNVKIFSEPDIGIYDGINKGIAHATGDIIGLLHSDDEFGSPGIIERIAQRFSENDLDVVYGNLIYVDRSSRQRTIRYWKSKPFSPELLSRGWMPPHPTLFIKKSVFLKFGLYETNFKISADYEYILRILADRELKIEFLPEVITKMAIGGKSNKSVKNIWIKSCEDYSIIKKKNIQFPFLVLLLKNFRKLDQFLMRPPNQ